MVEQFSAFFCLFVLTALFWYVKRAPHDTPLSKRVLILVFSALVVVLIANSASMLLLKSYEAEYEEVRLRNEKRKAEWERLLAGRKEKEDEDQKQRAAQGRLQELRSIQERQRAHQERREKAGDEPYNPKPMPLPYRTGDNYIQQSQQPQQPGVQGSAEETDSFYRDNLRRVRSEQEIKLELALNQAKERAKDRNIHRPSEAELRRKQAEREKYEDMRKEYAKLVEKGEFGDDEDHRKETNTESTKSRLGENGEWEEKEEGEEPEEEEEHEEEEELEQRMKRRLAPVPPKTSKPKTKNNNKDTNDNYNNRNNGVVKSLKESVSESVTILVKTHARYECVFTLIASIRNFYPTIRILIADDGADQQSPGAVREQTEMMAELQRSYANDGSIEFYALPYDLGLSYSRNYLLDRVKTTYFVTCDDDFIFTEETRIESWLLLLEEFGSIDIVGGVVYGEGNQLDFFLFLFPSLVFALPGLRS